MGDRIWACIPSRYVTSQLGQLSLASLRGRPKSSTSFGWGKGWNVTSAEWQVTLCDPIWYVSSSSGVATSVSELLYPCYTEANYSLHFVSFSAGNRTRNSAIAEVEILSTAAQLFENRT